MRNFLKIASGLDTSGLVHQLACQPELWNQYTVRTAHPQSAHRVVDDVLLRYSRFDSGDDYVEAVCSSVAVATYPAWYKLPLAHQFIFALMQRVQGVHLGRCMISRVRPGVEIPLHSDRIALAELQFPFRPRPAEYYERYHLALASSPGCQFTCGEETVEMLTGELWWFNNQIPHSVVNNSSSDRLHLICDIRVLHDDYIPS